MKTFDRLAPHADHLSACFDLKERERKIEEIVKEIKDNSWEFDAIAVRGVSGMMVGSIVSYVLKKDICVVRKSEKRLSRFKVESSISKIDNYLILDDLIDTGATIRSIVRGIRNAESISGQKKCIGALLYDDMKFGQVE